MQDFRKDLWHGTLNARELASSVDKLSLLANYDSTQANNFTKLLEYELVGYDYELVFNLSKLFTVQLDSRLECDEHEQTAGDVH